MIRDAIILGAGAAGLMCAMTAGRRGFSCAVIDHSPVAGRKVRLAGGGKGNVTNRYISPEWYVGTQKGFPDTLLKRCSTDFVLSMLASFGIEWDHPDLKLCLLRTHHALLPAHPVQALLQAVCTLSVHRHPELRR